jgi:hypothetical protein
LIGNPPLSFAEYTTDKAEPVTGREIETRVGAAGTVAAVTALASCTEEESPFAVFEVTRKLYEVLLVKPVTVALVSDETPSAKVSQTVAATVLYSIT